ncbi:uncharacterized protein LOC143877287 [Tasmannia lanceolata]|uniref:uncharacterized protein LOC143877287 n=1 Tax=Tasmannia lanceolata TaxID=3420 RepID=UPI0040647ED3
MPFSCSQQTMSTFDFSLAKSQILSPSSFHWTALKKLPSPLSKTLTPFPARKNPRNRSIKAISSNPNFSLFPKPSPNVRNPNPRNLSIQAISSNPNFSLFPKPSPNVRNPRVYAGRSKKKPGGPSPGRIEGNAEVRREAKKNARRKSRRLAENLFYRLKNPSRNHADNFSEEELQMIGFGYDRMVRFMEKDDPNLRHPNDWYKYGQYGPYSWRGIVVGDPIRGRFSDERVSMISPVKDHEEWEEIERFEMASDFSRRVSSLDKNIGFKYFWIFVRHPKWRISDLPWEQWTLVCEVVLECGEKRLDKWNLMGRLGNKTRELITQCAAWMRPDIIYVKRPVYQCRFEPQDDFFRVLGPLLDPSTENQYLFELSLDGGRVEMCTYFGGLCKIVRANPKAFVDDVVNAYQKMNDERKSKCLDFLLSNHPVELLHPYTKEWKVRLEEMEFGCDSPDDHFSDDDNLSSQNETQITDWFEEDENEEEEEEEEDDVIDVEEGGDEMLGMEEEYVNLKEEEEEEEDENEEEEDDVLDVEEGGDEMLGMEEESVNLKENEKYWEEEFQKALRSPELMENLVKKSVETTTKFYKEQLREMDQQQRDVSGNEVNGNLMKRKVKQQSRNEWKGLSHGPRRRVKRSKIPPELFLRAAVRPFTYRNLVKEIVLLRHAIIDGEVSGKG